MTEKTLEQKLKEFDAASAKLDAFVDSIEAQMPGQKCDFFSTGFWQVIDKIEKERDAGEDVDVGQSYHFGTEEYLARLVYRCAWNYLKDTGVFLEEDKGTFFQAMPFHSRIYDDLGYSSWGHHQHQHSCQEMVILSQREKKALETLNEKRPCLDAGLREFYDFMRYINCKKMGTDLDAERQAEMIAIHDRYSTKEPQKDYLEKADEIAELLRDSDGSLWATWGHNFPRLVAHINSVKDVLTSLGNIERNYRPKEAQQ